MTSVRGAIVDVDLADDTQCTRWTTAHELVDQIMAGSSILTRVGFTVVDVKFTVLALKAFRTHALIVTDSISTRATVLARSRFAFIYFSLTIGTSVALMALAPMGTTFIFTRSVVAQP